SEPTCFEDQRLRARPPVGLVAWPCSAASRGMEKSRPVGRWPAGQIPGQYPGHCPGQRGGQPGGFTGARGLADRPHTRDHRRGRCCRERHAVDHRSAAARTARYDLFWIGRCIIGLILVGAAIVLAVASMRANVWFGFALSVDDTAGQIFASLTVMSELIAVVMPTANRLYRQLGERWTAARGWAMTIVA